MKRLFITGAVIGCVVALVLTSHAPAFTSPVQNDQRGPGLADLVNHTYLPTIQSIPASTVSCSVYADSAVASNGDGTQAHPWKTLPGVINLAAGKVLCLRGTTSGSPRLYRQGLTYLTGNGTSASPIYLMSYPGEHAEVQSTGQGVLDVRGNYWHVENLIIDNANASGPAVVVRNPFVVLRGNEIRNGRYNGIDVRGTDVLIESNQIHHFDSQVPGGDAQCVNLLQTGDRLVLRKNTIHDCSGDGIQVFNPNNTAATNVPEDVQITGNTFYRGTIAYTENAIDIKIGNRFTISGNDISGYGYETPQLETNGNPPILLHRYAQNIMVAANKIHDATKAINIHADQGATPNGITIENNVLYNLTGSQSSNAYGIQVVTANNIVLINNTLAHVAGYALSVYAQSGGRVQNNLIYASGATRFTSVSGVTIGNNGYFSSTLLGAVQSGTTTGTSPGFVNSSSNFHLTSSSPVIDKGTSVSLSTDFDGKPRVGMPDLGAYEYTP